MLTFFCQFGQTGFNDYRYIEQSVGEAEIRSIVYTCIVSHLFSFYSTNNLFTVDSATEKEANYSDNKNFVVVIHSTKSKNKF